MKNCIMLGDRVADAGKEMQRRGDKLKEFGCEIVQGYYFSKPLPVEEYEQKLNY